eukprot:scaffold9.g3304.t1
MDGWGNAQLPSEAADGTALGCTHDEVPGVQGLPPDIARTVDKVLACYAARTPGALLRLVGQVYAADARLDTPLVAARGRRELALQFYALQRMFSGVAVEPKGAVAGERPGAGQAVVTLESKQHMQAVLVTRTRLLVDTASQRVLWQVDEWPDGPLRRLPFSRRLNCLWTNGLYRLLGWERALVRAETAATARAG